MYIDTHVHLDFEDFIADEKSVVARAAEAGVERMITIGTNLERSWAAVAIADRYPGVWAAVGVHPHDAKDMTEDTVKTLKELAGGTRVVAIGETGLDYFKEYSPRTEQVRCFREQIRMAGELSLPLIIHDRDAHNDTLEVLREENARDIGGVLHCFSGDYAFARECLDLGFYISFTGIVTFPKAMAIQDVVRRMPMDRCLVETDAPFLAPVPHRGKRNEPAYVVDVARKIAEIRGSSLSEIEEWTTRNAQALFGL